VGQSIVTGEFDVVPEDRKNKPTNMLKSQETKNALFRLIIHIPLTKSGVSA
jgi:hypothetical protein